MKIKFFLLVIILAAVSYGANSSSLLDVYKKGEIKMVPDPEFGKNRDWDELFYAGLNYIAFDGTGNFFVTAQKQHKIFKFDKNGKLLFSFSQKGAGPGDTYFPCDLSILDNKYLVVNEYATNRRISIFYLNGKFFKLIRTNLPPFRVTALRNNKIAILAHRSSENKKKSIVTYIVMIKDIETGEEVNAATFTQERKKTTFQPGSYFGQVFLSRIQNGNLLVGYSLSPEIGIFSPEGEKIAAFKVNTRQVKITAEMKEEFYQRMTALADKKPFIKRLLKDLRKQDIFPGYTPYYRNIFVDSENNILICKHNGFDWLKVLEFQLYSGNGKSNGEFKISFGVSKFSVTQRLFFHAASIYGLLEKEESDDSHRQLVKVNLK